MLKKSTYAANAAAFVAEVTQLLEPPRRRG
jgi:hypothetical protein